MEEKLKRTAGILYLYIITSGAISFSRMILYLSGFITFAIGMYYLSLESARCYVVMLNGSTELYRLKVLDDLKIPLPKDLKD